jgi:periplasmic protein CpxP/Spy
MLRFTSLLPLAVAVLITLPACSSSQPAQAPVQDRVAEAPAAAAAPGPERRMVMMGPQGTPEERTARRLAVLDSVLTLSAEQEARLRPILLAEILDMPQMRREDVQNMTQEQMMAMMQRMQERRERVNRTIEAVLTPEQVTQYRAYLQQERERMMQRGRVRMGM